MQNQDLFTDWTPAELWLAGLLWADGHLTFDGYLHLGLVDEDAVALAAELAGRGYGTNDQPRQANGRPRQPCHRLFIGDHEIAARLVAVGFGPKPERRWPERLSSGAFLRGLFDGDGSVTWRQWRGAGRYCLQARLCGQAVLLDGVQDYLADLGIRPRKLIPKTSGNGAHTLSYNHTDSLTLRDIMYGDDGPCMARKRELFHRDGQAA